MPYIDYDKFRWCRKCQKPAAIETLTHNGTRDPRCGQKVREDPRHFNSSDSESDRRRKVKREAKLKRY